jgi:hypothetical protein
MALQPFVGPWPLFQFLNLHTVGRTPWTGDQHIARSLPTHRINAHRDIHALSGIGNHDPSVRASGVPITVAARYRAWVHALKTTFFPPLALQPKFWPWPTPWNFPFHFSLLDLRQSVGHLGRVISSSQGLSSCTQTQKNAHTYTNTIPASKRAKTVHALDRSATVTGT